MLATLFSFAAVATLITAQALPKLFSFSSPHLKGHHHHTSATGPGAVACNHLTKSLGADKVHQPGSHDYRASQLEYWNALNSDYDPTCAVYPTSAQDVSTALKIIKAAKSRFAIKTSGHNPNTFFSSVDQGVLIDLNSMTTRTYDASTKIGTYQPGGNFQDVYKYFQQHGRTVVGARLGIVGTGAVLGGGLSYLSPQYGLACDSFLELEVVLPSGEIVTASPTKNSDLFFAERGGGGNAYGVVTKYTVKTVPAGTFYAGHLVYLFDQPGVLEAIHDFMEHNKDPKATIIGTYQKILTPTLLNLDLDQVIQVFLVYDGPDPGDAFEKFTSIPYIATSLGPKTYPEVVDIPVPTLITEALRGSNVFRVSAHRLGDGTYKQAFDAWSKWCDENHGTYVFCGINFQPVPKSLTDASKASHGGNAMQLPDGPWFWLGYVLGTLPSLSSSQYDAVQASFRDMVNSVPKSAGLPFFPNDAHHDQNPLKTFSTYKKLQKIKKKYDPEGFFAKYTGGWNFNA